jgi:hypothetical protein
MLGIVLRSEDTVGNQIGKGVVLTELRIKSHMADKRIRAKV